MSRYKKEVNDVFKQLIRTYTKEERKAMTSEQRDKIMEQAYDEVDAERTMSESSRLSNSLKTLAREAEMTLEQFEKSAETDVWDSGLAVLTEVRVLVHPYLKEVCDSIQASFPGLEFSILAKGKWTPQGFYVGKEFVIPQQEVAGASVDYKEPLASFVTQGYNVVLHSHPFKSDWFSTSDDETINTNFPCSVLYSLGEFTAASVSMMLDAQHKLKQRVEVDILREKRTIEVDTKNIQKREQVIVRYTGFNRTYDGTPLGDAPVTGRVISCTHPWMDEEQQAQEQIQKDLYGYEQMY